MIDIIATIVAILALVVGAGGLAYLGLLQSAAKKRGAAGAQIAADVRKRLPMMAGATAGGLAALLLTSGGTGADIFAIVIGAASGGLANTALNSARKQYRSS